MNDEWSRCPICFEDYSLEHRPTTFICGHSTCIDHNIGPERLRNCPICRHELKQNEEYHVSYNLEEASRLFRVIKNNIDWSTVKLPSAPRIIHEQNGAPEMVHRDMIYARRLQAELNHETTQSRRRTDAIPVVGLVAPLPASQRDQSNAHKKNCGHRCDLTSTKRCCICVDRRPHRLDNRYEAYVDGRGIVNAVKRNEYYCSTCKRK